MIMKKLINNPEDITRELFSGLVKSNSDLYEFAAPDIITRKIPKEKGKVWIVFGQGAGHDPARGFSGRLQLPPGVGAGGARHPDGRVRGAARHRTGAARRAVGGPRGLGGVLLPHPHDGRSADRAEG